MNKTLICPIDYKGHLGKYEKKIKINIGGENCDILV